MEIVPYQRFHPDDKISNLPQELIDDILMRLTTREAVKTSILSKQWRYKWTTLEQLIFDDAIWQEPNVVEASQEREELATRKIVNILVNVLFLHQGPIIKFSLVIPQLRGILEISHYMKILSVYDIEEFIFQIEEEYMIPPALFMYSKLKYLKLSSCYIHLPPTFQAFKRLVKLELYDVILDDEELQSFVSRCPLLEHLVLHVSNEPHLLEFTAPMLKVFLLVCNTDNIRFMNSPLLAKFSVKRYHLVGDDEVVQGTGNLIKFLNSLPALEELFMGVYFMKNLAAGGVQEKLPARLIHLKTIKLSEICLDFLDELSTVLCLIRCSPNLEKLKLDIWRTTTADERVCNFLKAQDYSNVVLNRLQMVKMYWISGTIPEKELVKLLLKKALKLKQMVISLWMEGVSNRGARILTELNSFERASPEAQVILKV